MKSCFQTCTRDDCLSGAPCQKPLRRVRAGTVDAEPSNWVEIEPELPIDMAEPDPEPVDRVWFAWVVLACLVFWALVYFGVVL